jgi:hypothetical protein
MGRTMSYPTLEHYNEALQSPQLTMLDPALCRGTVKTSGLGLPLALCGGFALTYSINVDGQRFAVRCFHKESSELERRYKAVDLRLRQLASPYFLQFDFLSSGIRVNGGTFPVVKMAWAAGETLSEFLEREHGNAGAIGRLRTALASLGAFLDREGIAHGDIQPGNVMVSGGGSTVNLIDYDGMFVGDLRGSKATELGQKNFQHPGRTEIDFDERLDRFSFIALDVALHALMTDAGLWRRSMSEPEAVVFRAQDHADPGASSVYADVLRMPAVRDAANRLARIAAAPMSAVPSLGDFHAGLNIPAQIVSFAPRVGAIRVSYQGAYAVLNGTDYAAFLRLVGDKVELIGKVHSVKDGLGRNRRRYVFVNFSDWKGLAVKIAIWSDAFAAAGELPTATWVGRWVSMTAMVDAPFVNTTKKGVSYTHISLTLTQRGQMQMLTAEEAAFRLKGGPAPQRPTAPVRGANSDVVEQMTGRNSRPQVARPAPAPAPAGPPPSSNQTVINRMRANRLAPASSSPPAQQRPPAAASSGYRPAAPPKSGSKVWPWIIGTFIVFCILRSCAH